MVKKRNSKSEIRKSKTERTEIRISPLGFKSVRRSETETRDLERMAIVEFRFSIFDFRFSSFAFPQAVASAPGPLDSPVWAGTGST
jgi:hypothetical protein